MSRKNGNDNGRDVSEDYKEAFRRLAEVREQLQLLKQKADSLGQTYKEHATNPCMIPPIEPPAV